MRVAYVVSRYPGVSHTFIQREVAGLRRLGIEVVTVSVHRVPPEDLLSATDRDEAATTRHLVPLDRQRIAAVARTAARHPRAALGLARRALRTPGAPLGRRLAYAVEALVLRVVLADTDIRHVHAHFANVGADVARLAAGFGSDLDGRWTWSFTMHGPTEFADARRFDLAGKAADADAVICISDYCRSQLMALTPESRWDRFDIVRCGVDPAEFNPPEWRSTTTALRVLSVGRLVPEKGHAVLLAAVADLADRGIDVELTLVGDGPSRSTLEAAARERGVVERVRFLGAVGADVIHDHYRESDVFCLASFAEGVPVVLMEAMASELPVVTTLITGVPELVEDNVSGMLVPPGRADLLADALAKLANDPGLRARLGAAGRRVVAERFDASATAQELAGVFARLLH